MRVVAAWLLIMVFSALAVGCAQDAAEPAMDESPDDTWAIIQSKIFDESCVNCHVAGSSYATQSDLVLTADVSYQQLAGVLANNTQAREDGLLRLSTEGIPGVHKSYLWEKINWPQERHFLDDHPGYGNLMPLGGPPLTYGEIEFVRRWIEAGAPTKGSVVDELVLRDERRYEPGEFEGLEPPRPGEGIQLTLGPFEVAPFTEREVFQRQDPDASDLFFHRVEIAMRQGSHHFIMHRFSDEIPEQLVPDLLDVRNLRDDTGELIPATVWPMLYHEFMVGSQTPNSNFTLPPGVAMQLPASRGIDLNAHYVNRGADVVIGEVHLNLYSIDASEVQHVAKVLNLNNLELSLPPNKVTTVERDFVFSERRHIFSLVSHAHEHMIDFAVEIVGGPRDGEVVYYTNDWEHPESRAFDPPLVLETGQGLKLVTTYDNWTDRTLGFGLLSEDEMMILFGYYY